MAQIAQVLTWECQDGSREMDIQQECWCLDRGRFHIVAWGGNSNGFPVPPVLSPSEICHWDTVRWLLELYLDYVSDSDGL